MDVLIVNSTNKYQEQIDSIKTILKELEVGFKYLNLIKEQYSMTAVEMMVDKCDGVILVTNVEWIGVGYYMQKFLDQCFNLPSHSIFHNKYCLTITLSNKVNPYDETLFLSKAWTMLGGHQPEQLQGIIEQGNHIHNDEKIKLTIEKKIEDFYRVINSKKAYLPLLLKSKYIEPVVSVDKEIIKEVNEVREETAATDQDDIQMIANMFRNRINSNASLFNFDTIKKILLSRYNKVIGEDVSTSFQFIVKDSQEYNLFINVSYGNLDIENSIQTSYVEITLNEEALRQLLESKIKLYNAFLLGKAKVKGHVEILSVFDRLFPIKKI